MTTRIVKQYILKGVTKQKRNVASGCMQWHRAMDVAYTMLKYREICCTTLAGRLNIVN
jgi:hypothetical protein